MRPDEVPSGGHDPYFDSAARALKAVGLARPTLLLDLDRVDANINRLTSSLRDGLALRLVVKSLPCPQLIAHIMDKAQTNRLMVFHQPFLNAMAEQFPEADILLGKPLPVDAAARFYDYLRPGGFDPAAQLQWLIDTPQRLIEYQALAQGRGLKLRINVEIDVGLHRGGLKDPADLDNILSMIDRDPNLSFGGLMGYDAHVAKLPTFLGWQAREFSAVIERYSAMLETARRHDPMRPAQDLTLNAGGSPTFHLHNEIALANEVSVGSALVKPSDFDLGSLDAFEPAAFIATPVIKASGATEIPGIPYLGDMMAWYDKNRAQSFFIYGGHWMANPVSPPGLKLNSLYGQSSNQELLNGPKSVTLKPNDFVFLRPTQSEAVMLQFGDLAVMRQSTNTAHWNVLASES
mgnify:CR=1 FL=1